MTITATVAADDAPDDRIPRPPAWVGWVGGLMLFGSVVALFVVNHGPRRGAIDVA